MRTSWVAAKMSGVVALLARVVSDGMLDFSEAQTVARQVAAPAPRVEVQDVLAETDVRGQALHRGRPREFRQSAGAGQHFTGGVTRTARDCLSGPPRSPLFLEVEGQARRAYVLYFRIAQEELCVSVPAGSLPEQTAQRVAQVINRHASSIGLQARAEGAQVLLAPRMED